MTEEEAAANVFVPYKILSTQRVDGGVYHCISHLSLSTRVRMTFGLFVLIRYASYVVPYDDDGGGGGKGGKKKGRDVLPAMFWLSGLTCDGEFCLQAFVPFRSPHPHLRSLFPLCSPDRPYLFYFFFFFFLSSHPFHSLLPLPPSPPKK